jgi:hypothetical protein
MSPLSPSVARWLCLLLLFFLWQTPRLYFLGLPTPSHWHNVSYAQNLTTPTIGEASVDRVPESKISLAQWQALQIATSETLLKDPTTLEYFDTNFNIDGSYAELKSGEIVSHWDELAKTMGTSGLALAGAYGVWRQRRRTYLEKLRSGDGQALETLFEKHFGTLKNQRLHPQKSTASTPTPLPASPPPQNNNAWQMWGERQGLPVAGGTLAALFLLWQKKQIPDTSESNKWTEYFRDFVNPSKQESYRDFYKKISHSTDAQSALAIKQNLAVFNKKYQTPMAPVKSQNILDYEALNIPYRQTSDIVFQTAAKTNAIRFDRNAQTNEVKKGLNTLWHQYFYYQSQHNTNGTQYVQNQIQRLINFSNRFTNSTQKWHINNVKAASERSFKAKKQAFENFAPTQTQYQKELAHYRLEKQTVITAAKSKYSGWQQSIFTWWQHNYQKVIDTNLWMQQLKNLRNQSASALKLNSEKEEKTFKANLEKLTLSYKPNTLKTLLKGQKVKSLKTSYPDANELKTQIKKFEHAQQDDETWIQYSNKLMHAEGYKGHYRYGYTKYTYIKRRERWEHKYLGRPNNYENRKNFEAFYDRKIFKAKQQLKKVESLDLRQSLEAPNSSNPVINRLKNFINTLKKHPQDERVKIAIAVLQKIQTVQIKLRQTQSDLHLKTHTWAQRTSLEHTIAQLTKSLNHHTQTLFTFSQSFQAVPQSHNQSNVAHQEAKVIQIKSALSLNPVHQFITSQKQAKDFFTTYGEDISVIKTYKPVIAQQIDALRHLEDGQTFEPGFILNDYNALKQDYQKLLNLQLPDVWVKNWSWFQNKYRTKRRIAVPNRNDSLLHDWYHKVATVYNRESKQAYKNKIEAREALLFEQRSIVFEAQQEGKLQTKFTATQIKDYQQLVLQLDEATNQTKVVAEAQAIATNGRLNQVDKQNQKANQALVSIKTLAVQSLNKNDVTTISLGQTSDSKQLIQTHIPSQFLEPLWQAYRRYNKPFEFTDFKAETLRLIEQAKENYKRGLVANAGLAPEPVQTKTVHDFLTDGSTFNQNIDKQIKAIQAQLPKLKIKFAGQAFLKTALAQANSKILALERYRQNGPKEVEIYNLNFNTWHQKNAADLAKIEGSVEDRYADIANYTQGFWNKSETIAAEKAAEIEAKNLIDTRDTVETVEASPGGFSTEDESAKDTLKLFLERLSNQAEANEPKPILKATNQASNNQSQLYQASERSFLRSQGLTWDKHTNERIEKLHPSIRAKTIKFINTVQDQLNINLRVTTDGGYRSLEDQLRLYCNDKNSGICQGVAKWDDTGDWKSNAKPGESFHNYGLAVDMVEITKAGRPNWAPDWKKIARIGEKIGFTQPLPKKDAGHFEMRQGFTAKQLKGFTDSGNIIGGYINLEGLFPEAHFQVWRKFNNLNDTPEQRTAFWKESNKTFWELPTNGYLNYLKITAGVNSATKTEMDQVHQDIIKFTKQGLRGDIKSAENYLNKLRHEAVINGLIMPEGNSLSARNFPEDHFQVWRNFKKVKDSIEQRKAFLNTSDQEFWKLKPSGYNEYLKYTDSTSPNIKYEMKNVFRRIMANVESGLSGEIKLLKDYLTSLKSYSQTQVLDYQQAAHFAIKAYGETEIGLWGYTEVLNAKSKFGIKTDLINEKIGLQTKIYQDDKNIVVAFAGTQDFKDWYENFKQGLGIGAPQYAAAAEIGRTINNNNKTGKKITFIGHSLGGGLAATAAALTGQKAITYNSAGVHPATLIDQGLKYSKAELVAAFGILNLAPAGHFKTGNPSHKELVKALAAIKAPNAVIQKFNKQFTNIENHVTRGDLLTDVQEDLMFLPLALGKNIMHGSILNNINDLALMNRHPFLLGFSKYNAINSHRNYGQ